MKATWEELCSVETEIQKLYTEAKLKKLEKLENTIALQTSEIEKSRLQQQYEHTKKVNNLQQCEIESHYSMIKMMSTTLQNYYNMMRGSGTLTDIMKEEFKQLIKLLEGVRNIKWSDMQTINHEECFYSLTCLSVTHLMDPLNSKIPTYVLQSLNDQDASNATFSAACSEEEEVFDTAHNTTITLEENSAVECNTDMKAVEESMKEEYNNRNCTQEKAKKRVLSDKNNITNITKTSTKQVRKISPKRKNITICTIGTKDKENKKHMQKSHVTMSAKSIAILNKLKADKLKKENLDMNVSDGALKMVREKERRRLMTAHPYQKPNGKQK